jgi:hypothetical protein
MVVGGKRRPVDLSHFPRAATYLERHREVLEKREYLVKGKRKWYEIWVAQDPLAWPKPKLVFPDISESPRFALDISGAVVNGDCYWMSLTHVADPFDISLMLAVGNSTFAEQFYDSVCGNRLYAGRRRYITQYVEQFPLPCLSLGERERLHGLVLQLQSGHVPEPSYVTIEAQIDNLVWAAFGLSKET